MENLLSVKQGKAYDRTAVGPALVEGSESALGSAGIKALSDYGLARFCSPEDIKRVLKEYRDISEKFPASVEHLEGLMEMAFSALLTLESARDEDGTHSMGDHKLETHLCGDLGDVAQKLYEMTGKLEHGETSYEAWRDASSMMPSDPDYSRLAHHKAAEAAERLYDKTGLSVWQERRCMHLLSKADICPSVGDGNAAGTYFLVADIAESQFDRTEDRFWAEVMYDSVKSFIASSKASNPRDLAMRYNILSGVACKLLTVSSWPDAVEDWFGGMFESAKHCESFDPVLAAKRYSYAGVIALDTYKCHDVPRRKVLSMLESGYKSHVKSFQLLMDNGLHEGVLSQRYYIAGACSRIADLTTDNGRKAKWKEKGWKHLSIFVEHCERKGYPQNISEGKVNNMILRLRPRKKK